MKGNDFYSCNRKSFLCTGGNEMNNVNPLKPPCKQHRKDPCFSLRHFNCLWTNYVIPSQVATADGLVQWPVSIRGQGGLLLGMDTSFLGSLPAWVPSCLLLLLGANRANKVARFQAGVKDAIRHRRCCNTTTVTRGSGTHTHMQVVTTETQTANGASHLGQSLSKDWW